MFCEFGFDIFFELSFFEGFKISTFFEKVKNF